jgi:hypothetical protein
MHKPKENPSTIKNSRGNLLFYLKKKVKPGPSLGQPVAIDGRILQAIQHQQIVMRKDLHGQRD